MITDVAAALTHTNMSPAASWVNHVLGYTAATRTGASGVATHNQRAQVARAAKPQAPAVAMTMATSMVTPAPDDQSSAYLTCLPLTVHSVIGSTSSSARIGGATIPPWQIIRRSCGIALVLIHRARRLDMCVFRTPNEAVEKVPGASNEANRKARLPFRSARSWRMSVSGWSISSMNSA